MVGPELREKERVDRLEQELRHKDRLEAIQKEKDSWWGRTSNKRKYNNFGIRNQDDADFASAFDWGSQ